MFGQTSFHHSSSKNSASAAPAGLTVLLFGLIICYQVISHLFMHQAINHEEDEFDSDASCTAVAGPSGYSCMESKLFSGWHDSKALKTESAAELDSLLEVTPPATTSVEVVAPVKAAPSSGGLRGDAKLPTDTKSLEDALWDMAFQMGGGDKTHEAPEKHEHKPKAPPSAFMAKTVKRKPRKAAASFAKGLADLQQELEAKMQAQARRHAQHRAIRALHLAKHSHTEEAPATPDKMTTWAHNLDDLTHDLEAQMQAWRTERANHDAAMKKVDPMTPWAHDLDDLTHNIEEHMEHRKKERAEHEAAQKAQHAARLKAAHAANEAALAESKSPIIDEVEALGRQLCQDPERRNRPSCAQFLHEHSTAEPTHEEKHANDMAHIKLLEKHLDELHEHADQSNEAIRQESMSFLKEMCADPARRNYPTCAELRSTNTVHPAGAPHSKLRSPKAAAPPAAKKEHVVTAGNLRWSALKEAEMPVHATQHVNEAPLMVDRKELRGAHWESKIPKVACVTVLPQGQVTETLMKYFMDNYNLQHYEGERELVIVYHDGDKEASRIAHLYADGAKIKAAAARGESGYPSATSYRYGAWMGRDADLVVRWDFEAWHHPNRISMQVRAIAHANRPVSLVTRVTAFDADGKNAAVAGGAGAHGSLMGDAAWMRKHWMPLLEEENAVVHGLHSRDVVQIDMPELLAYHDTSMLGGAATKA